MLVKAGQIGRRGCFWWVVLLEKDGAADVVVPIARLERQWPGGPVLGTFTARYGPDDSLIGSFSLRASNDSAIPKMMDEAARRIDALYTTALNDGRLRRSEEHTSELQSLMRISYAVFCLKKKKKTKTNN